MRYLGATDPFAAAVRQIFRPEAEVRSLTATPINSPALSTIPIAPAKELVTTDAAAQTQAVKAAQEAASELIRGEVSPTTAMKLASSVATATGAATPVTTFKPGSYGGGSVDTFTPSPAPAPGAIVVADEVHEPGDFPSGGGGPVYDAPGPINDRPASGPPTVRDRASVTVAVEDNTLLIAGAAVVGLGLLGLYLARRA